MCPLSFASFRVTNNHKFRPCHTLSCNAVEMAKINQNFDYLDLLTLIDGLRARKARPDKTRIVSSAMRKHGVGKDETLMVLDAAVQDAVVLRVRYKDGFSYRNPGRSIKGKRSGGANAVTFSVAKHRLLLAVRRQYQGLPLPADGVSYDQIMQDLHPSSEMSMQNQEAVNRALDKEVENGNLMSARIVTLVPSRFICRVFN